MWTSIRKIERKELLIFLPSTVLSFQPSTRVLRPTLIPQAGTNIHQNLLSFRFISTATTIPQDTNISYLDSWCSSNTSPSAPAHFMLCPYPSFLSILLSFLTYILLKCSMFIPAPVQHMFLFH